MKIVIAYIACTFFFLNTTFSQLTHSITLGPDLGFPTKTLGASSVGLGGSIEYRLKFSAPVAIQLHAGYIGFTSKASSGERASFVPLRIGVAGTIYKDIFFIFADAGTSRFHSSFVDSDRNGFSFGAGAGYYYSIGGKQILQVSGYYNLAQSYDWLSIRIAYGLSWGKGKKEREQYFKNNK